MVLKKVYRKEKQRYEYALVSKSNPKKVLEYFGTNKPSEERFRKAERRVQFFKRQALVKRHLRKGKIVKAHTRKLPKVKKGGLLTKEDTGIFSKAAMAKKEYGGVLDFNKRGRLERFTADIGTGDFVIPQDPDWETEWHSHPKSSSIMPSPDDLLSLVKSKAQQAEVIFRGNNALIINKGKKSKSLSKKSSQKLLKEFNKDLNESFKQSKGNYSRFKNIYRHKLKAKGLNTIKSNIKNKPLKIPIKVVE